MAKIYTVCLVLMVSLELVTSQVLTEQCFSCIRQVYCVFKQIIR